MTKHLKYGGSTAARTIQCPAWMSLTKDVPFTLEGSNPAADEGTMLHNCMEMIYKTDDVIDPYDLIGESVAEYKGQKLTPELVDTKLSPAIKSIESLLDDYDIDDWHCEPFVKISDDMGGSIDFIGRSEDKKTVVIADYKFGYNSVEVVNNAQAQFYALAAATDPLTVEWFGPELENIVLAIIQPNGEGDDLQTWTIDLNTIDDFETTYLNAVDESEAPNALAKSGPYCK